ncbi:carbohydrate ABC transporter permease [Candidatus Mycoplasma mahonii]|uniref:carbohydrate ABC transporter permease n=1 Tax=Candidatus Mycoplasma mahonii TaxID=3004105 RepID=UPI0026E9E1DF|nr:sugar ABC transporter permease [Candidatus Mycoplasma mahonii]WKX02639.1 sugar ABC transporter permease [Candidatus Mycoplasma mahonii]
MDVIKSERKLYSKLKYNKYQKKEIILETVTGWSFLSPLLVVAIIFSSTTIVIAFWLTFQNGVSLGNLHFVGFDNWKKIFNPALGLKHAFMNTLLYAVVSVPIILIMALIISGILNASWIKGKRTFLAIFFLPQVTSAIASTLIFKQLFSKGGIITIDYISNPNMVIWVVIISAIWGSVAGSLITFNTAFATINKDQYEAADLDGANGLKKFLNISMPSIGPIISYALIMGIIGGFGVFDGPYLFAATTGVDQEKMATLIFKGFQWIIPASATSRVNWGLGTTVLFMTAILIALATFIGNLFFPMSKRTN